MGQQLAWIEKIRPINVAMLIQGAPLMRLVPRRWRDVSERSARVRLTLLYSGMFLLLGTVLLLGALTFLPAAVLGPVAEQWGPIPFGG